MIDVPANWWQDFFSGVVVDMWLRAVPEEQTRLEIDFIRKMLRVEPPTRLLDVPCGGGRHSFRLAAAGYRMTGVDISADFLAAARSKASERNLPISWVQGNMSEIAWREEFDGAFCFGNCFGYLDDEGNAAFLKAVYRSLKPGASFALDYPMVLEARVPHFQERNWFQLGDIFFLEDEQYDPAGGRTVTEYTLVQGGAMVKRPASHRNYTYREICRMFDQAGFSDVQAYGSLSEEPFKLGSQGLFLVGVK
jgi:SAM-dependent methyltransferase